MFDFRQLIGALFDYGCISEDELSTEGNSAYLWLQCNPSCSMFVTLIVEDDRVFLLKELLSLPALGSITSLLIVQQQANMILEYDSHVGRVCMDATNGEDDEPREITLMYSLAFPTSIDVDSAAQLIAAAGNALTTLKDAMEPLESRIVDGWCLDSKDAFLVPVGQEENTLEITINPAVRLLKLSSKQRELFLSFINNNEITIESFLQTKKLHVFSVVTDECEIYISNGSACWQIEKLPIAKDIRRAELEALLSGSYETYRSACVFLGISSYKSLRDFVSEVDRTLY